MTATSDPVAEPTARFFLIRHYNDIDMPLAKQLPGLRRYTRSHGPTPVVGDPGYPSSWTGNIAALEAAFASCRCLPGAINS